MFFLNITDYKPNSFNKKGEFTNENQIDINGLIACIGTIIFAACPCWAVFLVYFKHFDCIQFIFDDILPDKNLRSEYTNLLVNIARFILVSPAIVEIIRSLTFFLPAGAIYLTFIFNCTQFLMSESTSLYEFYQYYQHFTLTFKYMDVVLSQLLFVIITADFYGTAAAISFSVEAYGKINKAFYIILLFGILIALLTSAFAFSLAKGASTYIDKMINDHIMLAKRRYVATKTKHSKFLLRRVMSLKAVRFSFGSFFSIEGEFGMKYFSNLTLQVFDGLLMFDLK